MDRVKIEIRNDGKVKIQWSEMGEQCWSDAETLYRMLADLGVKVDVVSTEPKPMEAEEVTTDEVLH